MKRDPGTSDLAWRGLLDIARARSKFFLKYGERFDRRLYSEIDSLVRISLKFRETNLISSQPEKFKELAAIQKQLLERGQDEYLDFP